MKPSTLSVLAMLAVLAAPAPAQQVALGRLFATPDERGALDRQRLAGPAAANAMPGAAAQQTAPPSGMPDPNGMQPGMAPGMQPGMQQPGAAPAPAPSSAVQLSGVLRGSSGRTTVWLNQVPQDSGVQAAPGNGVALRLSSGRQLILKPGQSFDASNGSVQDLGR